MSDLENEAKTKYKTSLEKAYSNNAVVRNGNYSSNDAHISIEFDN